ncbi:hypothetical protein ACG33_13960 [Steroidobacter denitrificans]|uniref:Peptidase M16 n=1 Tax=Steroidobacter denitrificans TaxID=465721 RepID=A0A127FCS5_STEDE|nr:pitrilysin family protein [Steroidobacter denitrificans]AMN48182.1 hypothetical protein ACG33_13960 [Steroidobacter denitrificans]
MKRFESASIHMILGMVFVLACLLAGRAALAGGGVKTPDFTRLRLANGVVILLMEQHDVPLIAFEAVLRGGALGDPPDTPGVAAVLASLLEKGAGARDAGAFARAIADVGGIIETSASAESISIGGSFLARDQALMVELLTDMLQRPHLASAQFEAVRARRIEFIRAAKDSSLSALTSIYGMARLFGEHPYGRPVSGSEASLARISRADLSRYYQDQLGADRLIIAIAGDFHAAQMQSLVSRAFEPWRRAGKALPEVPPPPGPVRGRSVLLIDAPDSAQSYFWAGSLGVARSDPRRAALDVANTLFGGRFTSMLNSELRVRTGLSYGAASRFERLTHAGSWALTSFTRTETTIAAIDLALQTLDTLHEDAPHHGALDTAAIDSGKRYIQGQFPLAFETAAQWASQLASLEFYGFDRSYIDGYSDSIDALTLEQTRRAVEEIFPHSRELMLVVIGNANLIGEKLRKYGPLVRMKLSDTEFRVPADSSRATPTTAPK